MNVRLFNFPTYDEWAASNFTCEVGTGPMFASIRVISTSNHCRVFKGTVFLQPQNGWERCVIGSECIKDEYTSNVESVEEWYNNTCIELNRVWDTWAKDNYSKMYTDKVESPFDLMPSGVFHNLFGCIVFSESSDGLHRLYAAANRCLFDKLTVEALQDIFDRCRIDLGNGHIIWFSDDESKTLANYIRPKLLQKLGVDVNELTN